jgi:hypothetical protein
LLAAGRIISPLTLPLAVYDAIKWAEEVGETFGRMAGGMLGAVKNLAWLIEHSGAIKGPLGQEVELILDEWANKGPLYVHPDWMPGAESKPDLDDATWNKVGALEDKAQEAFCSVASGRAPRARRSENAGYVV